MWERRRYICSMLHVIGFITTLAVCATLAYSLGLVESIGFKAYVDSSPPLTSTTDAVTLGLAHSRYLTIESISLTLTNHSTQPIYLPAMGFQRPANDTYVLVQNGDNSCVAIAIDSLNAHGWQSLGRGCNGKVMCPGGMAMPRQVPDVLAIEPGETATFALYGGQDAYPLWKSGQYRVSVLYTRTPFPPTRDAIWPDPPVIPHGVTLTSEPMTLAGAWWIPPWYHQSPPQCPFAS